MTAPLLTPMMQQYRDAKERHPGMLLLFRMGDFFELFDDDAELAARELGLTLTSRDKTVRMAGFPHHQLESYLQKLLRKGHRVAVCDQVEDTASSTSTPVLGEKAGEKGNVGDGESEGEAETVSPSPTLPLTPAASKAPKLVRREVVRIVTPGTITEDNLLDPRQSNHVAAICSGADRETVGVSWLELSTGQFHAADFPLARLPDELARLAPAECICSEKDEAAVAPITAKVTPAPALTGRPSWTFENRSAHETLHHHFGVAGMDGFGFEAAQPCLIAAGALLCYAQEMLKTGLDHIRALRPYSTAKILQLDLVTRRSLELTRTLREGERDGSLLAAIDRTCTTMGARLLHEWLLAPLAERGAIEERLDAVAELTESRALRDELRQILADVQDLLRLTSRVSTARATPRDLGAIGKTLKILPRVKAKLTARRSALLQALESRLELCADLREALEGALVEDPPQSPRDGGLIRPGFCAELDELRDIARGGKEWIARFQAQECARTGIGSLKVGFNKVFGYYIEITHTHAQKIPPDYQRKQTLKNAERYITPELKEYEEKVLSAEDKSRQREYELFAELRERIAGQADRLLQTGEVLAHLDVLAALAELAAARQYVRPEIVDEQVLAVKEGRHPVLEQALPPGTFVPNDVYLSADDGMLWLITGPNMSGKSTFIRQVALLTLMAHMGSFLPARAARVGLTDRIFTRVGASDELSRGQSTFMVEMTEAANILNNATPRSLVILDEIGRGTSTYDGVSLAWAITEHLHHQVGCRALFATHYHELAQLAQTLPRLRNYNVLVREWQEDIVFLHKIAAGHADQSYGIHVARLAGIPLDVLSRAREVLGQLESHHLDQELPSPKRRRRSSILPDIQPLLFGEPKEE